MKCTNIILAFVVVLVTFAALIFYHEQVHVQAYEYFGYHNTTVSYGLTATTHNYDNISEDDRHWIYLANMQNEAVAYNLMVPNILIVFSIIIISYEVIDIKKLLKR